MAMLLTTLLLLSFQLSRGCDVIELESEFLGSVAFRKLPLQTAARGGYGRAAYVSSEGLEKTHYLYFDVSNPTKGSGRWIINEELGIHDHAIAYVESWAVEPYMQHSIVDVDTENSRWKVVNETSGEWHVDQTLRFTCMDKTGDQTLYFDSSRLSPTLSGYYVRQKIHHQGEEASSIVAYSHVKNMYYSEQPSALLYLFKMGEKWLIGESVGEDACYTYVEDNASAPELIQSRDWHYLSRFLKDGEPPQGETELGWTVDEGRLYHKSSFTGIVDHSNAFEAVRFARTIKFIPTGQSYRTLRNGLPMPIMGLGTGGLHPDETYDTLITSLRIGYRLFDLAREYNNEAIFARVLETIKTDPTLPQRDQLFIESKVWPTELGFVPTSDAIETSLAHLNTNYIDLYMLHWPECNPNIEWMHCHDTINPEGTWRESWRALERAYAEGRVASIGVSNFDVRLLDELYEMAVVKPHVVQNFAQPGEVDKDVRAWCAAHQVLYQPYASIRNLDALPAEVSNALHRMAAGRSVSPHSVAIRFFVQSGAGVIPRSRREDHLRENMGAFDYELSAEEMRELGWHGDEL